MEHNIIVFVYKYWFCLSEEDGMEFVKLRVSTVEAYFKRI